MSEDKKGGSAIGQIIGYLVLIAAILGVIFWFLVMPKLEERGYSKDDLGNKVGEIKEKVTDTAEAAGSKIKKFTGKTADKIEDTTEAVGDFTEKAADKVEKKTDAALEVIDLD